MSPKRKPDPQMPLGKYMGAMTRSYFGALSKKLEHLGTDRHFSTLLAIQSATEKCTQQYLSDILDMDKVSMVRMLDYLVSKGMITRTVNPADRREHIVELTAKAKKIMPAVSRGIKSMNETAFKGVNKHDREVFYSCLAKILNNLEDLPAHQVDIKLKKR